MKKLIVTLVAAFMVFAVAGTAAAFSTGDLVAVIYNEDDNEVALNLGTLDYTQKNLTLSQAWSLDDFSSIDDVNDLSIGMFSNAGNYNMYFATTLATAPSANLNAITAASGAMNDVLGLYSSNDEDGKAIVTAGISNSYDSSLNLNSNSPGAYNGLNLDDAYGEANFKDDADYVDMYLYGYELTATGYTLVSDEALAVFRFYENGSIAMNPVPVPAAGFLLGSGLLALVGLRRKS